MPLKTLFLNPPSFDKFDGGAGSRWPATREIESYWYPVWLAYPAGMLEGSRLLDAPPHHVSVAETIEIGKQYEFLVLFTSAPGFQGDVQLARAMREANPKLKVCFVGPHVTTLPEAALAFPEIDFVCRREFEFSVVDYANGVPLDQILGVSFRGADGKIVHTAERPYNENLDEMPDVLDVYKRDMDVTRYNVPFLQHPFVALYTSRGCPAQCVYCLWPQTLSGHRWRTRSAQSVAKELAKVKQYWPEVKEVFFDDDTFNINQQRTIELCEAIKPLGLTWSCTSRVTTSLETLQAMKAAGCRLLIVGFESGDPEVLKNIKKGANLDRARQFVKDCKKVGLAIHGDFILGLPGETKQSIRNTINFAKELNTDTIQVSVAHAYPGTEFYDYVQKNNFVINTEEMVDAGGHQVAHIQYPDLPSDYIMEMVNRFYDEYYIYRPKIWIPIVLGALFNGDDRRRLYKEAKEFLTLRSARNKAVADARKKAEA